MNNTQQGLYIALIHVHGLTRWINLELGRDPDTGGQTKYVIELAQALIKNKNVQKVDILTRLISDPKISSDYAQPVEYFNDQATPKTARIIRLKAGPNRYLRKEVLWPYIHAFTDSALRFFRQQSELPDIIPGHYADGGLVDANLSSILGIPFFFRDTL